MISLYVSGQTKPQQKNVEKIAAALDVSAEYLLTGKSDPWQDFFKFPGLFLTADDEWELKSKKEKDFLTSITPREKDFINLIRNGSRTNKDLILYLLGEGVIISNNEYKDLLLYKEKYKHFSEKYASLIEKENYIELASGQLSILDIMMDSIEDNSNDTSNSDN